MLTSDPPRQARNARPATDTRVRFHEVQRFRQIWLWSVLIFALVPPAAWYLWGAIQRVVLGHPWGRPNSSNFTVLLIALGAIAVAVAIMTLFWKAALITQVDDLGLHVRFVPFHPRFQRIPLRQVETVRAVRYHPIWDYGGWGIRYRKKARAYNIRGNEGVLLTYRDGKTLLIGSQRCMELEAAIRAVQG